MTYPVLGPANAVLTPVSVIVAPELYQAQKMQSTVYTHRHREIRIQILSSTLVHNVAKGSSNTAGGKPLSVWYQRNARVSEFTVTSNASRNAVTVERLAPCTQPRWRRDKPVHSEHSALLLLHTMTLTLATKLSLRLPSPPSLLPVSVGESVKFRTRATTMGHDQPRRLSTSTTMQQRRDGGGRVRRSLP